MQRLDQIGHQRALAGLDESFDRHAGRQLDVAEAAFLAALPKAPNSYNPERHPEAAKDRRDWVIDRMAEDGFVTPAQAKAAKAEPLVVVKHSVSDIARAPYFAEEVRRTLVARYGEKALYQGGLTVRTSLNPQLQVARDLRQPPREEN